MVTKIYVKDFCLVIKHVDTWKRVKGLLQKPLFKDTKLTNEDAFRIIGDLTLENLKLGKDTLTWSQILQKIFEEAKVNRYIFGWKKVPGSDETRLRSLEELKAKAEIKEEQYASFKKEYEGKAAKAKIGISNLKNELKNELAAKEADRDRLRKELEDLEVKAKIDATQAYASRITAAKRKTEKVAKAISYLQKLISAESLKDLVGAVPERTSASGSVKKLIIGLAELWLRGYEYAEPEARQQPASHAETEPSIKIEGDENEPRKSEEVRVSASRRPLWIAVFSVLLGIGAVWGFIGSILMFYMVPVLAYFVEPIWLYLLVFLGLTGSGFQGAVAVGLWKIKPWARTASFVLAGLSILGVIAEPNIRSFLGLIAPLALIWYLSRPEIKGLFGVPGFAPPQPVSYEMKTNKNRENK